MRSASISMVSRPTGWPRRHPRALRNTSTRKRLAASADGGWSRPTHRPETSSLGPMTRLDEVANDAGDEVRPFLGCPVAAALHDAALRVCRHRFDRRQRETGKTRLSAKGANRYRQRLFCKGGDLLGGREIVLVDGKAGSQRSTWVIAATYTSISDAPMAEGS